MNILIKILLSAISVMVGAYVIPGVKVSNFTTAIVVAIVLGLLNFFLKPILVILTIPVTIVTLGLFLLVINTIIIYLASSLVNGFYVSGFWSALFFSFVLSIVNWLLMGVFGVDK